MTTASVKRRAFTGIRKGLSDLAKRLPTRRGSHANDLPFPSDSRFRRAVAALAADVAFQFETYWGRSGGVEGPIDVIDLFSGSGGMSAGFRAANGLFPLYRLAMASDIDALSNKSYETNLGLAPTAADVSALANDEARLHEAITDSRRRPGMPLVLIGCAPCQGFSSHRNAGGMVDSRNGLFVDFARIAAALCPEVVVVENVPELLSDRYWPVVCEARSVLEDAGYVVHLGVHNMAAAGVPQERFRALMLAMKKRFLPPVGFLERSEFRTVRDAIGGLPQIPPGRRGVGDPMHFTAGHRESTLEVIRAVPKDGGSRPPDVGPECLRRAHARQGKPAYEDVYGRLYWDRPAITVTGYARNPASGRFVHPEQDRGLSVREASLLQGFPADYWFAGSLDEKFRQVGNAVPPPFAAMLAVHIVGELLAREPKADSTSVGIREPVGASFARLIPSFKRESGRDLASLIGAP